MTTVIYCPCQCASNDGKDGLGVCNRITVIMDPIPAETKDLFAQDNRMGCRYFQHRELKARKEVPK
jgi:hypothetical protein